MNKADTNELYWVQLPGSWIPSLTLTLRVQLHTKRLVTEITLQTATGAQSLYSCTLSHTVLGR